MTEKTNSGKFNMLTFKKSEWNLKIIQNHIDSLDNEIVNTIPSTTNKHSTIGII